MNVKQNLEAMHRHAKLIQHLAGQVHEVQARWKPDNESWSILEVVNHLYDEEREDFRTRLEYTLYRPGESWPDIDPKGWVSQRRYNDRSLGDSLDKFWQERQVSLNWLADLAAPDWHSQYQAPWGPISAGDLMAAWVAHDLLHIRQLVELTWSWTVEQLRPFSPEYAGKW